MQGGIMADYLRVTRVVDSQAEFDARKRKGALNMLSRKKPKHTKEDEKEFCDYLDAVDKMSQDALMTLKEIHGWNELQKGCFFDGDIEEAEEYNNKISSYLTAFLECYGSFDVVV